MEFLGIREPFNGQHVTSLDLACKHQAGVDGHTVDHDGAGAAITNIATELGAGQVRRLGWNRRRSFLAVYGERDVRHVKSPLLAHLSHFLGRVSRCGA